MQNEETKKTESAPKPNTPLTIVAWVVGLCALAVVLTLLAVRPRMVAVQLGHARVAATIADNHDSRAQGLSDTQSLPGDAGMLFVFQQDDTWQFWMKDMHYNLDIIWLDANKKVVTIAPDVTPASYPQTVYSPSAPARYVLEVNAGFAAKNNITVGEKATFTLP